MHICVVEILKSFYVSEIREMCTDHKRVKNVTQTIICFSFEHFNGLFYKKKFTILGRLRNIEKQNEIILKREAKILKAVLETQELIRKTGISSQEMLEIEKIDTRE